jgi:DNA (cytosine-5)-methyltransferase 1
MKNSKIEELLEEIYQDTICEYHLLTEEDKRNINKIVNNIDYHKAVATALITSLVKKVINPYQDVRFHKVKFGKPEWDKKGYSARSFDRENVTPWIKKRFRKWAMKESAWLARSIEQPYPFTLDFPGHIKNKEVKNAFLRILHKLEEEIEITDIKQRFAYEALNYLILRLKEKYNRQMQLSSFDISETLKEKRIFSIQHITDLLNKFFNTDFKQKQGTSYIPVIAIFSLLQVVIPTIERYKNKKLGRLKPHTSSDRTSFSLGDIEILNEDGSIFEVFEIKHNIPITREHIEDIIYKIKEKGTFQLQRFYILTTANPNIKPDEIEQIKFLCNDFLYKFNIEIIPNGVILTIKYFLRLLENPEEFIINFTKNLQKAFHEDSILKEEHIQRWKEILKYFEKIE